VSKVYYGTITFNYFIEGVVNAQEATAVINETLDAFAESTSPSEMSWDEVTWTMEEENDL